MGFIIATFVSGLIVGSLIPGYLTRKEKEKFESELQKQFVVELHEQLDERSKIMCQNCYFKKRIEKLEEE